MEFPKFLLGDNTDFPTAIFVIHTDYPRFIINLEDDSVEWLEDFSPEEISTLDFHGDGNMTIYLMNGQQETTPINLSNNFEEAMRWFRLTYAPEHIIVP